jgi:hypothetical protein
LPAWIIDLDDKSVCWWSALCKEWNRRRKSDELRFGNPHRYTHKSANSDQDARYRPTASPLHPPSPYELRATCHSRAIGKKCLPADLEIIWRHTLRSIEPLIQIGPDGITGHLPIVDITSLRCSCFDLLQPNTRLLTTLRCTRNRGVKQNLNQRAKASGGNIAITQMEEQRSSTRKESEWRPEAAWRVRRSTAEAENRASTYAMIGPM